MCFCHLKLLEARDYNGLTIDILAEIVKLLEGPFESCLETPDISF